jgi:hypothetical protein
MTARRDFRKVKASESCPEFESWGEGGCCSLETKYNTRKVPRGKLLVSDRRLQKQRSKLQQTDLGSTPDENFTCRLENRHDRNGTKTKIVLFWQGIYRSEGHNPTNLS